MIQYLSIYNLRAVPFKSTWEGVNAIFYFSVGCGGETILFSMLGEFFFLLVGGGLK